MKDFKAFYEFWQAEYAAYPGFFILFMFFWIKFPWFRKRIQRFFPTPGKKIIGVLDLVLKDSFDSFSKINRLELYECRNKRFEIIDEITTSVYLKICKSFDDEINIHGEPGVIINEKKLFESVFKNLKSITNRKIMRTFDDKRFRLFSEIEFRDWISERLCSIYNGLERDLQNAYPEENLIIPLPEIKRLISLLKSDIRDSFFTLAFKVKDLQQEIENEILTIRTRFEERKESIFKDFLS